MPQFVRNDNWDALIAVLEAVGGELLISPAIR